MQQQNEIEIIKSFLDAFKPPPIYTVSEWADANRMLSTKSSSEPGRWRTSRTPYLKSIMDDLSDYSPFQEIVFKKAAQIGATEAGNNWIGYTIDHAPAPMLAVLPNLEVAKRSSRQRIAPLIEETAALKARVNQKKVRDSDNTILQKDFPGGTLIIAGANSPSGLRSMPAKKLFLDEIDAYPLDCGGEGSPVKLAEARARTFGNKKKVFKCSTPTVEGHSAISTAFDLSDQKYYYVPCPRCGHEQKLVFENLKWEKDKPETAKYICCECKGEIKEYEKTKFLELGKWVAENPDCKNDKISGYHLSSLYSPLGWFSWQEIAKEWLDIQKDKDQDLLKTFINTVLGETWKEKTDVPDYKRLYERREFYDFAKVPDGVFFLTCGVDVQGNRLEAQVVGHGRNKESWSIENKILPGDTTKDEVWLALDEFLDGTYPKISNQRIRLPIRMTCVDSGYNTQIVYNWARKHPQTKVVPIKGSDTITIPVGLPKSVDINLRGKLIKRGVQVWTLGVSLLKQELYGWLKHDKPLDGEKYPAGFCHFPQYDVEFFQQLTAEELRTKIVRGYRKPEWVKTRERNEALDTKIYARAASIICGSDRWSDEKWKQIELETITGQVAKKKPRKKRESSWL